MSERDAEIAACKWLGIKPDSYGLYPSALVLLDEFKKKLIEQGCSFGINWDVFHALWYVDFLTTGDGRVIISDENWELTKGSTELAALVAAINQMPTQGEEK